MNDEQSMDKTIAGDSKGNGKESSLLLIEEACYKFERQWQASDPIDNVKEHANSFDQETYLEICSELAAVDMELRWRNWAESEYSNFIAGCSPTNWDEALPRFQKYAETLDIRECIDLLAKQENWCRNRFGDLPGGDECEANLPKVSVTSPSHNTFETTFCGKIILGRQNKTDSVEIGWSNPSRSRLVIAAVTDVSVSRNQFSVVCHTDKLVKICNLSTNRCFGVHCLDSPGRDIVIEPKEVKVVSLPLIVAFIHQRIRIRRDL